MTVHRTSVIDFGNPMPSKTQLPPHVRTDIGEYQRFYEGSTSPLRWRVKSFVIDTHKNSEWYTEDPDNAFRLMDRLVRMSVREKEFVLVDDVSQFDITYDTHREYIRYLPRRYQNYVSVLPYQYDDTRMVGRYLTIRPNSGVCVELAPVDWAERMNLNYTDGIIYGSEMDWVIAIADHQIDPILRYINVVKFTEIMSEVNSHPFKYDTIRYD